MDLAVARAISVGEPLGEKLAVAYETPRNEVDDLERFNALAIRFSGLLGGEAMIADDIFRDTFFIPGEGHYPELAVTLRAFTSRERSVGHYCGITLLRAQWETNGERILPVGNPERLSIGGIDEATPMDQLETAFLNLESTVASVEAYGKRRANRR